MSRAQRNQHLGRSLHANRTMLRILVVVPLTFSMGLGVAWANWSASSVPGGSGASAVATVNQGATPTAASVGSSVSVDWAPSTLSNGDPVAGYVVNRYDASTLALQTTLTTCTGTITSTSCSESGVPTGEWVYSVTPVLGDHWTGAESQQSNTITTDSTPPVNAISASVVSGNVFKNGGTVFYRGVVAGSFTVTNTVSDSDSGPASSATSELGGGSAGWSHISSTVSSPSGGPYLSDPFSWTAGTASEPTEVVTGRDVAGNNADLTLSFVNDSTTPTAGTITYTNGQQPGQSVVVAFTSGTDAGSGIATRQIQRASATLTSGTCGTFTGFADVGPDNPTSPYSDTQVSGGICYQYRYVVTDQVSNRDVAASTNVANVVPPVAKPLLRSAQTYSVLGGTAVVSTGITHLSGDLGVSPSVGIVGFPPGTLGGTIHAGDAEAAQAQVDLVLAYNDAAARTPSGSFAGDQNGQTFHAGVYHTAAAFALTGTMTLDAEGNPNAVFIFQVSAALNTAASSNVHLINGAQPSNVFWQVEGAAGIGALASFSGTILADGAITLGAGSQLFGRALCTGTVTLSGNNVTTS